LVTGSSRGFGNALSRELSRQGWLVTCVSRSRDPELDELMNVHQVIGDVTEDISSTLAPVVGDQALDLLVNNAGSGSKAWRLEDVRYDEMVRAFLVNVVGPARITTAVLPNLRRSDEALVINVTSRLGSLSQQASGIYRDKTTSYAYRVAKAAQNMLSISMANELQSDGIRVWAIHPGRLQTQFGGRDADTEPAFAARKLIDLVDTKRGDTPVFLTLDGEGTLPW
jgi:NAD(P)-dependent dehydrogenase (short-subunit alcohol dehydrogenase family)